MVRVSGQWVPHESWRFAFGRNTQSFELNASKSKTCLNRGWHSCFRVSLTTVRMIALKWPRGTQDGLTQADASGFPFATFIEHDQHFVEPCLTAGDAECLQLLCCLRVERGGIVVQLLRTWGHFLVMRSKETLAWTLC